MDENSRDVLRDIVKVFQIEPTWTGYILIALILLLLFGALVYLTNRLFHENDSPYIRVPVFLGNLVVALLVCWFLWQYYPSDDNILPEEKKLVGTEIDVGGEKRETPPLPTRHIVTSEKEIKEGIIERTYRATINKRISTNNPEEIQFNLGRYGRKITGARIELEFSEQDPWEPGEKWYFPEFGGQENRTKERLHARLTIKSPDVLDLLSSGEFRGRLRAEKNSTEKENEGEASFFVETLSLTVTY